MKRILNLILVLLLAVSLSACAGKQTGNQKSDYQAYSEAVVKQPKTFDRFQITGAKLIKIKAGFGKELQIRVTDELQSAHVSTVQKPTKWYDRVLSSFDNIINVGVPAALKGSFAYFAWDGFKHNQDLVSKDPVVVEQRLDTVTVHDTTTTNTDHDVEVVNQQELVIVQEPLIVETTTNNDNSVNTTNNFPGLEPDAPVEVE